MKHFHINGNHHMKTLCRETRHAEAAEASCVNNNHERDAADRRRRRATEVDARCCTL